MGLPIFKWRWAASVCFSGISVENGLKVEWIGHGDSMGC